VKLSVLLKSYHAEVFYTSLAREHCYCSRGTIDLRAGLTERLANGNGSNDFPLACWGYGSRRWRNEHFSSVVAGGCPRLCRCVDRRTYYCPHPRSRRLHALGGRHIIATHYRKCYAAILTQRLDAGDDADSGRARHRFRSCEIPLVATTSWGSAWRLGLENKCGIWGGRSIHWSRGARSVSNESYLHLDLRRVLLCDCNGIFFRVSHGAVGLVG
jgi:hypothetical protein